MREATSSSNSPRKRRGLRASTGPSPKPSPTRATRAACSRSDLLAGALPALADQLELCQKSLAAYLDRKRAAFPRLYFVSDPTLLEILSLGSDPAAVVPHFQAGLFDSLAGVAFDKGCATRITDMVSAQGERVKLDKPVDATGE